MPTLPSATPEQTESLLRAASAISRAIAQYNASGKNLVGMSAL